MLDLKLTHIFNFGFLIKVSFLDIHKIERYSINIKNIIRIVPSHSIFHNSTVSYKNKRVPHFLY